MKIGIVTQPLSRNYGGILQNYALQQTLIKLGHTPYTFDLGKYTWKNWMIATIKCIIKKIIGRQSFPLETPTRKHKKEYCLRQFVAQHINLITPRAYYPSIKNTRKYGLQAIIVGSDQVWRPKYNRSIEDMYLRFAQNADVKRIAYAASFGTGEWEYTPEQTASCRLLAQKFDAISVREDSAVGLCKKYLNVNAVHVIDPTMLLTAEEYKKLIVHTPTAKSPYLFAYILDETEEKTEYVKKCAAQLGLDIVIKGADRRLSADDSIEGWLSDFRDAEYIITDSFHGTVFSVIFNKVFNVILNKERGADRMLSLSSMLNINDRIMNEQELVLPESIQTSIDWQSINNKLTVLRKTAIDFLSDNLA